MQRGFNSLRGRSWFAESEFADVPRHWLIPALNVLTFLQVVGCGVDGRDPSRSEASCGHVGNVRSPLDGRDLHRKMLNIGRCRQVVEELHDPDPIEPQSSRDRAAIVAWSSRDPTSFIAESLQPDPTAADRDLGPRSTPDRGLIVAWSWPDRGPIVPRSGLFLKRNSSQFISDLKPQCLSVQTAPTTPWFRPHERVNCPWSSGQFSL